MIVLNSQLRNHIDDNEFTRKSDSLVDEDSVVETTCTSSTHNGKKPTRDKRCEQEDHNINLNHEEGEYSIEKSKSWGFTATSIRSHVFCTVLGYLVALIHLNENEDVHQLDSNFILLLTQSCQRIVTTMTTITSIMGTIYICTYFVQRQREQKYRNNHHRCRTEIQNLLGSIGAPSMIPMESSFSRDKFNIWLVVFFQWNEIARRQEFDLMIEKFAKRHVQFLSTIDTSIHMIRIATSIQLGLGPSSFSIDRVEKHSIHKRKTKPNLKRVREIICSVLVQEMKSIRLIREKASLCVGDDCEVPGLIRSMNFSNTDDDDMIDESLKSPHLLSISFLKRLRKTAGDLLSETIILCMSVPRKMSAFDNNKIMDCIKLSTTLIEELEVYVQSFLPSESRKLHHDSNKTDSDVRKLISRISTHLDAMQSATWACHQSLLGQKEIESDLGTDTETKQLWKHLGDEIEILVDLYQSINSIQFQRVHEESLEDDIDVCHHETEKIKDKIEYDDEGLQCLERKQSHDLSVKNKILVFSGKGAKSTRKPTQKNEKTSNCENKVVPTPFLGERSGRIMLLKELQNRLEMLEKVEEWDAVENRSCTEYEEKESAALLRERRANLDIKSPIPFLGVQGCLLSELQDAISKNNDRQNDCD